MPVRAALSTASTSGWRTSPSTLASTPSSTTPASSMNVADLGDHPGRGNRRWAALLLATRAGQRRSSDCSSAASLGCLVSGMWLNSRQAARRKAFEDELPDFLMLIASALRSGLSFQQGARLERGRRQGRGEPADATRPPRGPDGLHPRAGPRAGRRPDAQRRPALDGDGPRDPARGRRQPLQHPRDGGRTRSRAEPSCGARCARCRPRASCPATCWLPCPSASSCTCWSPTASTSRSSGPTSIGYVALGVLVILFILGLHLDAQTREDRGLMDTPDPHPGRAHRLRGDRLRRASSSSADREARDQATFARPRRRLRVRRSALRAGAGWSSRTRSSAAVSLALGGRLVTPAGPAGASSGRPSTPVATIRRRSRTSSSARSST